MKSIHNGKSSLRTQQHLCLKDSSISYFRSGIFAFQHTDNSQREIRCDSRSLRRYDIFGFHQHAADKTITQGRFKTRITGCLFALQQTQLPQDGRCGTNGSYRLAGSEISISASAKSFAENRLSDLMVIP